jgi:hypothetical protein
MQRRMLIRESALQRPVFIQTVVSGLVRGDRWGRDCGYVPAIGGKRMAISPRKRSPQVMVCVLATCERIPDRECCAEFEGKYVVFERGRWRGWGCGRETKVPGDAEVKSRIGEKSRGEAEGGEARLCW